MTPVMYVDPSGESFLLIGGAILLGGLIGGLVGVFTATDDENLWGSFTGGFINGVINTTGLAAALATGGSWAYIIAVLSGFTGGYFGSMANQSISYGSIDRGISFANGIVSAVSNGMVLYGSNTFMNPLIGKTWGARFVEAILPSLAGYAISVTVSLLCLPNVNSYRNTLYAFLSQSTKQLTNQPPKFTIRIDFSWRKNFGEE